jgi:hypothetical protein
MDTTSEGTLLEERVAGYAYAIVVLTTCRLAEEAARIETATDARPITSMRKSVSDSRVRWTSF